MKEYIGSRLPTFTNAEKTLLVCILNIFIQFRHQKRKQNRICESHLNILKIKQNGQQLLNRGEVEWANKTIESEH